MTYEGSNTLWLGDIGVLPGDSCIKMYGDYLKCDAVQVSHHGWGSASWEFFKLLNPSILLWNNSEFGFQYADKYQGYGKTESSTRLFNMPCVKQNYFCNTIKMQYINLPFEFLDDENEKAENKLLVSAASDRTFMLKLSDGKLIMINGGWRDAAWSRYNHDDLMKKLFGEMQYFAGSDTVQIAAYIMTDEKNDNQFLHNLDSADFRNKVEIENIISASTDKFGWSRRKSCIINCLIVVAFSIPCILGFNVWSKFQPLGAGTGVLDLEDFVVSSTLLPLGSLLMLIFCCHKKGWGWSNFIKEADTGNGLKFPKALKFYLKWILPIIIIFIFVKGYIDIFSKI
jgi:hypothetical protein